MQLTRGPSGSGRRREIMARDRPVKADDNSCCKRSGRAKTLWSYFAAVASAFLACLCCSLPLIPLMLGLSAGSTFLSLTKQHVFFDVSGGLLLFGSLVWLWREHKTEEKSVWKNRQFWTCLILTFTMYGVMNTIVKQSLLPKISAIAGEKAIHPQHR